MSCIWSEGSTFCTLPASAAASLPPTAGAMQGAAHGGQDAPHPPVSTSVACTLLGSYSVSRIKGKKMEDFNQYLNILRFYINHRDLLKSAALWEPRVHSPVGRDSLDCVASHSGIIPVGGCVCGPGAAVCGGSPGPGPSPSRGGCPQSSGAASLWVEFTLGVLNDSTQPGPLNLQGLVRKELEADPGRRETTPQGVPLAQRPCPPEPASGLEAELGNGGITSVTYLEVLRGVRP